MPKETITMERKILDMIQTCGNIHDIYDFCGTAAREMVRLVSYDQARVIFLNENGKIFSSLLYGVKQNVWNSFLNYYSDDNIGSKYSLKEPLHLSEDDKVCLCDWTNTNRIENNQLFEETYVRPLQLKYCLGIGFTDTDNCLRSIISLDRTGKNNYSEDEIHLVRTVYPFLNNLHINFFAKPDIAFSSQNFVLKQHAFTKREMEIAELICGGVTPKAVSERLCISINTTYKHIANMYKKLNVTTKEEFILNYSRALKSP